MRACRTCHASIGHRGSAAKYCEECAYERCRAGRRRRYYSTLEKSRRYGREYYWAHREAARVRYQEYRAENLDRLRASGRRRYAESVKMYHAHRRVRHSVRCGELVRPKACSECGLAPDSGPVEAHHACYERPLDVTWLCHCCHSLRHRKASI